MGAAAVGELEDHVGLADAAVTNVGAIPAANKLSLYDQSHFHGISEPSRVLARNDATRTVQGQGSEG